MKNADEIKTELNLWFVPLSEITKVDKKSIMEMADKRTKKKNARSFLLSFSADINDTLAAVRINDRDYGFALGSKWNRKWILASLSERRNGRKILSYNNVFS